ncbi:Uncharacterized protein YycO, partial [Acetitomaculum ruminis DSM 5522]
TLPAGSTALDALKAVSGADTASGPDAKGYYTQGILKWSSTQWGNYISAVKVDGHSNTNKFFGDNGTESTWDVASQDSYACLGRLNGLEKKLYGKFNVTFNNTVNEVGYLSEKDYNKYSGWMVLINGEARNGFVRTGDIVFNEASTVLENGDKVDLNFTMFMGLDLGQDGMVEDAQELWIPAHAWNTYSFGDKEKTLDDEKPTEPEVPSNQEEPIKVDEPTQPEEPSSPEEPSEPEKPSNAEDASEVFPEEDVNKLIEEASKIATSEDEKSKDYTENESGSSASQASGRGLKTSGKWTNRKGVILVTKDKWYILPLGHAAIIYDKRHVVEAQLEGVVLGDINWRKTKKTVYEVTPKSTTAKQDAAVANWCYRKVGKIKDYNFNYLDINTRKRFYCSQLIYAGYKDLYGIDLNTSKFKTPLGNPIHPMELVTTPKTRIIYKRC